MVAQHIDVLIPDEHDREFINDTIYHQLCVGIISKESKTGFLKIVDKLAEQGAQGVILGCTEIGMLIQNGDTHTPLFDTTQIHAKSAALYALEN